MHSSRAATGDVIAGVGGAVLLLSLFLPWYGVSVDITGFRASDSGSGREVLGFIGILLYLISIAAVAIVVARAAGALPATLPVPVALLGLGALAVLLVIYRIVDIPTDGQVPDQVELSRKAGILVALAGAAAVAYGGWRANTQSRARRAARTAGGPRALRGLPGRPRLRASNKAGGGPRGGPPPAGWS